MKTSPGKKNYPGPKQILRIIKNGKIKKDILALEGEKQILDGPGIPLLVKLFDKGKLLRKLPSIVQIQISYTATKFTSHKV